MTQDERYMRNALALAAQAAEAGDVPIGAVLTIGEITIEARNEKERRPDATAHAEILAIQEAARRLRRWRLSEATLYVTKEPCIMCAGAILAARIGRVVYAASDPKGGADGSVFDVLRSPKTNHRVEVTAGRVGRGSRRAAAGVLPRAARRRRRPGRSRRAA